MKTYCDYTPLHYQISEYDCGTTTLLNALKYLFKREEFSPEIYKFIVQHTLDKSNDYGEICKGGTSIDCLEFLCNWLNKNGPSKGMNIYYKCFQNTEYSIYNGNLRKTIKNNGVAILEVYQDCEHYCLLTDIDETYAYIFDPYYLNVDYYDNDPCIEIIENEPFLYNRKVLKSRIDEKSNKDFSLLDNKNAKIIALYR